MIKQLTTLILCILTCSVFANYKGPVDIVANLAHTPNAIVFDDTLVVFYQLDSNGSKVHFSVANTNEYGQLIWDGTSYSLDPKFIASYSVPATPTLLGDTLYIFGRNANGELIYNSVNSLADLKNNIWRSDSYSRLSNIIIAEKTYVSALEYAYGDLDTPPVNKQRRILLAYYEKNSGNNFSSSDCKAIAESADLVCTNEKHIHLHGDKYSGAPHLRNTFLYQFQGSFPELAIRKTGGGLGVLSNNPQHGYGTDYQWWSNSNYDIPASQVDASVYPIGTVQNKNAEGYYLTHLYYQSGENLFKANEFYNNGAYDWHKGVKISGIDPIENLGVNTTIFNGRAYTFYADKKSSRLMYYSDVVAESFVLPGSVFPN